MSKHSAQIKKILDYDDQLKGRTLPIESVNCWYVRQTIIARPNGCFRLVDKQTAGD